MVLPRKHLPLACIDFHASHTDLPQSRFFEAHIKILDLETRMGCSPAVLLARHDASRNVYALERQDNGLYVACRLGHWVELDQLAKHATATCRERLRPTPGRDTIKQSTPATLTTPQLHKDQKQKRAAIEAIQSLVRKRARSQSVSTFDDVLRKDEVDESTTIIKGQLPSPVLKHEELQELPQISENGVSTLASVQDNPLGEPPSTQTADDIFDTIRAQYSEALYKSMVCDLSYPSPATCLTLLGLTGLLRERTVVTRTFCLSPGSGIHTRHGRPYRFLEEPDSDNRTSRQEVSRDGPGGCVENEDIGRQF